MNIGIILAVIAAVVVIGVVSAAKSDSSAPAVAGVTPAVSTRIVGSHANAV